MSTEAWVLFGRVGAGFQGLEKETSGAGVAARLLQCGTQISDAVAWLRPEAVTFDAVQEWESTDGPVRSRTSADLPPQVHFPFTRGTGGSTARGLTQKSITPTFLVVRRKTTPYEERVVMCCSRVRSAGLLFSRVGSITSPPEEPVIETVLRVASQAPETIWRMSDESHQATNLLKGTELELKFTLADEVAPWSLADYLASLVQEGDLDGFIPDVGNELQRWSHFQDTFALTQGGRSKGYAAFMYKADGTKDAKFKEFESDSLYRRETFDLNVQVSNGDLEGYLRNRLPGLEISPLPRMTRSRFDVNVQSSRHGHYYGIEIDEVSTHADKLRQLEIEYHRTPHSFGVSTASIEPELMRLRDAISHILTSLDVRFEIGYLSKLTFLRSSLARTSAP